MRGFDSLDVFEGHIFHQKLAHLESLNASCVAGFPTAMNASFTERPIQSVTLVHQLALKLVSAELVVPYKR